MKNKPFQQPVHKRADTTAHLRGYLQQPIMQPELLAPQLDVINHVAKLM